MAKGEVVRLHAVVQGHVQGVGFRFFVVKQANDAGARGWVRNLHSGDVELVAEGSRAALDALLAAVRQGPRGSQVINVQIEWGTASGEFRNFGVRPTG